MVPSTACFTRCVTPHHPWPRGGPSTMYSFGGWCGGTLEAVALDTTGVATQDTATRHVMESSQLLTCSRKPPLLTLSAQVSMRVCASQLASKLTSASATLGLPSKALSKFTSTKRSVPPQMASSGHEPISTVPHCSTAGEALAIQDILALLVTDESQLPARSAKLRLLMSRHSDRTRRCLSPCASMADRPTATSGVHAKGASKLTDRSSASDSRQPGPPPSVSTPSCTAAGSELATQETLAP
mmetsp:Transcript_105273/g.324709  ORF Transcript_105273/g.324709 Transcript_105273/m.324709 type:complete len:242 (+) Transcript_105273:345-1070(+)